MAIATAAAPAAAQPAAPAQPPVRQQPIDEVAADLAYGLCPLFLAGPFSLTGPELAERGFGKTITKLPHPRLGEMSTVTAKRPDGEIVFGGAAGKNCTVIVDTPQRAPVLARLHANMAFTGLGFKPVPNPGASPEGLAVETFKAPVDNQFLYLQLIQVGGPAGTGPVIAQLFGMDK
jgi:hypothetical protein